MTIMLTIEVSMTELTSEYRSRTFGIIPMWEKGLGLGVLTEEYTRGIIDHGVYWEGMSFLESSNFISAFFSTFCSTGCLWR